MKKFLGLVAAACLCAFASAPALAQSADEAAKLAEAHSIVAVMFPPAKRQQMMTKLENDLIGQVRSTFPASMMSDPGLKSLVDDFFRDGTARQHAVTLKYQPQLLDEMAVAYTHEFSLAELKGIRAFAQTPAGAHYLSSSSAIVGDPVVGKVNIAMFAEMEAAQNAMMPPFKEKVKTYLKAHPDLALKIVDEAKGERRD